MACALQQQGSLRPACTVFGNVDCSWGRSVESNDRLVCRFPSSSERHALFSQNFSLYGQDTRKVTRRLTLTYGLIWDVNPPLKGKNLANDPFTVTGLSEPSTMTLSPRGTPLYKTSYGNVAPRLGLAYQLSENSGWWSVLRGGFGVFYDLGSGSL